MGDFFKKQPTMHTNNPWSGEVHRGAFDKKRCSRELNPLCVTILTTSATRSGLLFQMHPHPEYLFHSHGDHHQGANVVQSSLIPLADRTMTQAKHHTTLWYCMEQIHYYAMA